MSVRFDDPADTVRRDGDQVPWDGYTVLFFFNIVEDTGNYQGLLSLEENALDSWHVFETDPTFRLWAFLGFSVSLNTLVDVALDEWYVAAFTHSPTQIKSYVRRVVDPTFTTATQPDTTARTFNRLVLMSDFAAEFANARGVGCRVWSRELTPEQLDVEAVSLIPVDRTGLFAAYEMFDVNGLLTDTSGNGRDLTAVGVGPWQTEGNPDVSAYTATISAEMPGFSSEILASVGYLVTLDATMPGFSSDIEAARGEAATISAEMPGFTSAIDAARGVAGDLAATMPGFTSEISAVRGVAGAIASEMPGFSSSIAAARGVAGDLAAVMPGFTSSILVTGELHPTAQLSVEAGPAATLSVESAPTATLEVF